MARILCEMDIPRDPVSSHLPPTSPPNSCSTCSPVLMDPQPCGGLDSLMGGNGLQVFVGAGVPVNEETLEREVRGVVKNELTLLVRDLTGKQGCDDTDYR